MSDAPATLIERLRKGRLAYRTASGAVYAGPTAIETEAADSIAQLERDLAEARAEIERWAEQALKEEDCRKMWQAERDRLAAEVGQALSQGYWEASVYHCPPPRSRRDHPLKNAATIRLSGKFGTEDEAIRYAEAQILRGWANTTTIHQETAKPKATFWLSRDAQDSLGRLSASLQTGEKEG